MDEHPHSDPPETASPAGAQGDDLDAIIAGLDVKYDGKLPAEAISAAQRCREQITPRLIALLQKAIAAARAGKDVPSNGHVFAMYLLAEFQAKEALPAILEAVSLPLEESEALFGSSFDEDLSSILAVLAADTPEAVVQLVDNPAIDAGIRWTVSTTYVHWVRDGVWSREQAVAQLREHLAESIRARDAEFTGMLVSNLTDFAATEALGDIEEAFRLELVDPLLINLDFVQRAMSEGESFYREQLERCPPTGIANTLDVVKMWSAYQERDPNWGGRPRNPAPLPLEEWRREAQAVAHRSPAHRSPPPQTIQNTKARVGRNNPCPCGSGKKFKKCCGRR